MTKELTIAPENLTIANAYLESGDIRETSKQLAISTEKVTEILNKQEVKRYIDTIYLDTGYRNRELLGNTLDNILEEKILEMQESGMTTKKDILEVLAMVIKFRESIVKEIVPTPSTTQINIDATNPFGNSNYGNLMQELMKGATIDNASG